MTGTVTWSDTVYMTVIGLFADNESDPGVMKEAYKNRTTMSIKTNTKYLEYNFVVNDINAHWRSPETFYYFIPGFPAIT